MSKQAKRISMSLLGVIGVGISVGLFKVVALGIDPFQTFMSGLNTLFPMSFGTLFVIVSVLMLAFGFIVDRHYIGVATFINLFLLGYVIEYSTLGIGILLVDIGLGMRMVMMILAVVMLCFFSALYFTADLGVSAYDAIALIMANKWHVMPFKYCRITTDFLCLIIGVITFFLGGGQLETLSKTIGIGTLITAFFMGPLIDYFAVHVARPFLDGTKDYKEDPKNVIL